MAKKTKVKLELSRLNVSGKITLGNNIVTALTGNANYTTPNPTLSNVTTAIKNLDDAAKAAKVARDVAKTKTSIQDDREADLDLILTQLGHYIESTASGDATKIKSAGVNIKGDRTPVGELDEPINLEAQAVFSGTIRLTWKKVTGAVSYVVQFSPDPITDGSWTHSGVATKSSYDVQGLKSGTKYWFQVAAVGTAGQGPWSDPATKYAL